MTAGSDIAQFGVQTAGGGHRHALAPILIGLLAPVLVILIIDAKALASPGLILQIYLLALFAIAAGAYFVSLFDSGEVTRARVDREKRLIVVEKTGLISRSDLEIRFSDVAAIRLEARYDDDGYETAVPVIVLTSREIVPLPAGTTETDIAQMRNLMARG